MKNRRLETITGIVVLNVGIFLLIEGLSSTLLALYELARRPVRERHHTRHDADLGWVNLPNFYIEDMYGPGRHFKTNARGFRNDEDFPVEVPEGKIRIICSGDSFTLGYGVGNKDTWCEQLRSMDTRVQTVNMGQGGYGLDQAYLWYLRDGTALRHDIHILAFITDDFWRMKDDKFLGYGKPVLQVKNDTLVVGNVPVPHVSYLAPRLTETVAKVKNFRLFQILQHLYAWMFPSEQAQARSVDDHHVRRIAEKVFSDLHRLHTSRGSQLVLVYLPAQRDHFESTSIPWRGWLKNFAAERGIVFIDLVAPFTHVTWDQVLRLFRGHYSEEGNQFIASALYERLLHSSDKLRSAPKR